MTAVITYSKAAPQAGDTYAFTPFFQAMQGTEKILMLWVTLTNQAKTFLEQQLQQKGIANPGETLDGLLVQYGARRAEARVREILAGRGDTGTVTDTVQLTSSDVPELIALALDKTCDYQHRSGRNLFCLTPAKNDQSAGVLPSGQLAAPTSRAICNACDLPGTDILCSHLLHPDVSSVQMLGIPLRRQVSGALCDLGREEAQNADRCRASGHDCWQRIVEPEPLTREPISPLGLAESFDMLDALWRLAFGGTKRLLVLTTAAGPAALSLGCTTRDEFESRLSALADLIDKLKVDDSLLPPRQPNEEEPKGSLDRIERALRHQLPAEQQSAVLDGLTTLRRVRQARNRIQHGVSEGGGFAGKLRELGIHDAPPNWAQAWETVRILTTNALAMLRTELRRWADTKL